ncbi:MAG: hypothetical protein M3O29_02365 [Actinomycetota bacterium]|nr:hypothetical protein [Actinomycetota bacterium]
MSRDPKIADEDLEGLLSGHPHARDTHLDLARFVDDLRATFPADAPASEAHLAAIMETANLFVENGDPAMRPASNADAPVPQVSRLPKRKGNHMKERKLRILVLRVAAPIVALFTVLGIMGSAGALPRGLQRMTSSAAGLVGVSLPSGEDTEGDSDLTTVEDDQGDDTKDDSVDATNEDDQGDNNDDQGENDQGSTTNEDDQGDNSQDDTSTSDGSTQDDQGDSGSGSGDNNQN